MSKKKTHSEYIAEVQLITSNIEVIGQYIGANIKIRHRCKVCEHKWDAKPNTILSGRGCPECAKHQRAKSNTKTHEQFVVEVAIKNPNIEVIGEYINANTNIMHRCTVCGHEWMIRPSHALHGLGCPSCQETSGEQRVKQWLIINDVEYEYQKRFSDCKNQRMLPFDFYLPNYNCCIEYDGAQHFREVDLWGGQEYLSQRQFNDQIKNDYCKKNNIYLIRIRYDEDIYQVLNNALGLVVLNEAL